MGPPETRPNQLPPKAAQAIPGDIVIKFKDEYLPPLDDLERRDQELQKQASDLNQVLGSETIATYPEMGWVRIQLPPQQQFGSAEQTILKTKQGKVDYVTQNYQITLHSHTQPPPTTDWLWTTHFLSTYASPYPNYSYLWGHDKIRMQQAWSLSNTTGGTVIIAVLDTGIDLDHPDLVGNYANGTSFCGAKTPKDKDGHGTHVAGIIGAKGDNGSTPGQTFFVGVNKSAKIMPIRIDCGKGPNITDAIAGIHYAIGHGAAVINGSWGLYGLDRNNDRVKHLKNEIESGKQTTLYIASAGNEGRDFNSCSTPTMWPQMFALENLENLFVVAGTSPDDSLWGNTPANPPGCKPDTDASNYGDHVVHIAAPGEHIWGLKRVSVSGSSGDPLKDFVLAASGTSAAAPFVAGCAGLLQDRQKTTNPASPFSPVQLKSILMSSGAASSTLQNRVASGSRLDCYAALLRVS